MDLTDGTTMLWICVAISVVVCFLVGLIVNCLNLKSWYAFIPTIISMVVTVITFILSLLPNKIGGYRKAEYFGVFIYALWITLMTPTGGVIIIAIKKALKK